MDVLMRIPVNREEIQTENRSWLDVEQQTFHENHMACQFHHLCDQMPGRISKGKKDFAHGSRSFSLS